MRRSAQCKGAQETPLRVAHLCQRFFLALLSNGLYFPQLRHAILMRLCQVLARPLLARVLLELGSKLRDSAGLIGRCSGDNRLDCVGVHALLQRRLIHDLSGVLLHLFRVHSAEHHLLALRCPVMRGLFLHPVPHLTAAHHDICDQLATKPAKLEVQHEG